MKIRTKNSAVYVDYSKLNNNETQIMKYVEQNGEINRRIAEDILKKGKTHTYKVIKSLIEKNYIMSIGKAKNTRYLRK